MKNAYTKKLIELRREKNWTQAELAEQVDLSRLMIVKYEQGQLPSQRAEKKIINAFNLPDDYFKLLRQTSDNENSLARRVKPIDGNVLRKKLMKVMNFLPEDQLFIELAIDQVVAKYEVQDTINEFMGNVSKLKGN